ncbi:MAG: XrtA/PEP-CTERM system amidotransferase [Pseudomonadota bacterium]
MCGIAGIIHVETPKPVDPVRVKRMCEALVHRGPDGDGVWTAQGIGLGHQRLSVIDLAGSPQPMLSADGRAVITFNGEIYNYRALRRELEQAGARFETAGDTEVILAAWQRWGEGCLARLDGMFAFVLYDLEQRKVLLARDRFGVKPLYLARLSDGSLAFASELKGLLAHPLLRRRLNPAALDAFLTWGYVPDTHAVLAGVEKLAAGHFMLLEQGKPLSPPKQWWDISFTERAKASKADLSAQLIDLLRDAVQSRMAADVPLGAFLSGGVDSSSVVALMSEASKKAVRTCSIGFEEAGLDESAYAQRVADQFSTAHHSRVVCADDFSELDRLGAMFDEPFADASALSTWRVCQLAREHVTVALSGDGADEAFAGYRRQVFHRHEERLRALIPQGVREGILGSLGQVWPKADWAPRPLRAKATLLALAQPSEAAYAQALSVTTSEARGRLYSEEFAASLGGFEAEQEVVALMRSAPARSGLDRAQYVDLKFWLPGDILTKIDRTSMAVSLEAREPLLDHRLVEFAARLPERLRVQGATGKVLLKKSMERYLPRDILYRPKQGFVTPIAAWLRGPLAAEALALARSPTLSGTGWFKSAVITELSESHIAGRRDNSRILWQLLMLERAIKHLGLTH